MPSYPRYLILRDKSIFHVTWQCHNRDFHLQHEWAKQKYYDLLMKYKNQYHIQIYSYCFMSNHPHITGYVEVKENLSHFMRLVNSLFAKFYNKKMGRRGQLVMDRFKSSIVETTADLLKVMNYVDLNPKRANIVKHPKDYKWSSFRHYAFGETDPLVSAPDCYLNLGSDNSCRQKAYIEMTSVILENDWKEKRKYSSQSFIGSPDWVILRYNQLIKDLKIVRHKNSTLHMRC